MTSFANALPRVEDPLPDTIGLGTVFAVAGAGGVIGVVSAALLGVPSHHRDEWSRRGLAAGFVLGIGLYLIALIAELF